MITITVNGIVNISLSVGDTVYVVNNISEVSIFNTGDVFDSETGNGVSNIIKLGTVNSISQGSFSFTLQINEESGVFDTDNEPSVDSFLLFSKDNSVELSSLVGYYNKVRFSNNSSAKAELFSVGVDIAQSSK